MTMETALVKSEERDLVTPEQFEQDIATGHKKALILQGIVESQKLYTQIGKGKHLRVEGWITLAQGYGYTCKTRSELIFDRDAKLLGIKGYADVVDRNGIVKGGADSYCMANEEGKEKQTVSQLAGMAQTRAESRAYRELLSWVVVLAGYSPTPYEEIQGTPLEDDLSKPDKTSHWCAEHDTAFFKKGNMKGYAHPIGDTKQWHNEPEEAPKQGTAEPSSSPRSTQPAEGGIPKAAQRSYTPEQVTKALGMTMAAWLAANPGKTSAEAMQEVKAVIGER